MTILTWTLQLYSVPGSAVFSAFSTFELNLCFRYIYYMFFHVFAKGKIIFSGKSSGPQPTVKISILKSHLITLNKET
jgi:hypothetical protein